MSNASVHPFAAPLAAVAPGLVAKGGVAQVGRAGVASFVRRTSARRAARDRTETPPCPAGD